MVTINKTIKRAIEKKGKSLLCDPQLLFIVLQDLAPELEQERNLIEQYHTVEIGKALVEIHDHQSNQKEEMYHKLEILLVKKHFDQKQFCKKYLSFFVEALGCDDIETNSAKESKQQVQSSTAQEMSMKSHFDIQNSSSYESQFAEVSYYSEDTDFPSADKILTQRNPSVRQKRASYNNLNLDDEINLEIDIERYIAKKYKKIRRGKKPIITVSLLIVVIVLAFSFAIRSINSIKNKNLIIPDDYNKDEVVIAETSNNMTNETVQSTGTTIYVSEQNKQDFVTETIYNEQNTTENFGDDITVIHELTDFYSSVKNVTASSQLNEEIIGNEIHNYSPSKVMDKDLSTCWSEGKDDYGIGEELVIEFDDTYLINEITLWNGLCTNSDLYYKNARVCRMKLIFSDGNSVEYECKDGWDNRKNVIVLPKKIKTSSITIKIMDIYEGGKYKDTCISEISVA